MKVNAYLQITMKIKNENRGAAAKVYTDYRKPFLDTIEGALTKDLLIRDEDVQVCTDLTVPNTQRLIFQANYLKTTFSQVLNRFGTKSLKFRFTQ